jgi:hypothetical protein
MAVTVAVDAAVACRFELMLCVVSRLKSEQFALTKVLQQSITLAAIRTLAPYCCADILSEALLICVCLLMCAGNR